MTRFVRHCGLGPFEALCAVALAALVAFTGFSPLASPIQSARSAPNVRQIQPEDNPVASNYNHASNVSTLQE